MTLSKSVWSILVVMLVLGTAYWNASPAEAATTFNVTDTASLIQAIEDANDETNYPGADTIDLGGNTISDFTQSYASYDGSTLLPQITSEITLKNGTLDGDDFFPARLLAIDSTGTLTLSDITVQNASSISSSYDGGAVLNQGLLTVTNSTFDGNASGKNGIVANRGTLTVTDSMLINNVGSGGAIDNTGTLTVTRTIIAGNDRGAVTNAGLATIQNSAITGNFGGDYTVDNRGDLTILNSTIAGNDGGGNSDSAISTDDGLPVKIQNSIIWGNTAGIYDPGQIDVTVEYSIIQRDDFLQPGYKGNGNKQVDPIFAQPEPFTSAPTTVGDYRLSAASAAIDSGSNPLASNGSLGTTDVAGNPRYADDTAIAGTGDGSDPIIDMGAYEFQGISTVCNNYMYPYTVTGGVSDLRTAIDCANVSGTPVTIDLNGATYTFSALYRSSAASLPHIEGEITLENGTLDGGGNDLRLLYVSANGNLTLNRVTLENTGNPNGEIRGRAVLSLGRLVLLNSTVTNHTSFTCAALDAIEGTIIARNTTFSNNEANQTASVVCNRGGEINLFNSTLSNNTVTSNGSRDSVIRILGGNLTIERTTINNNDSQVLYTEKSNITVIGSTITSNSSRVFYIRDISSGSDRKTQFELATSVIAGNGGDVFYLDRFGSLDIRQSQITGNDGAVVQDTDGQLDTPVTITQTTMAHNNGGILATNATTITNSILWNTSITPYSNAQQTAEPNVTYSLVQGGFPGTGNIDADPIFVDPISPEDIPSAVGDYRLAALSPATDAASNTAAASIGTVDLADAPRYADDTGSADTGEGSAPVIDMGAYEFQGTTQCTGYTFPYVVSGGASDLIRAIQCANVNATADTIDLNGELISLQTSFSGTSRLVYLPTILGELTIRNGTLNGNLSKNQVLRVDASGAATLGNITVQNIGDTDALYNAGSLSIFNSTVTNVKRDDIVDERQFVIENRGRLIVNNSSFVDNEMDVISSAGNTFTRLNRTVIRGNDGSGVLSNSQAVITQSLITGNNGRPLVLASGGVFNTTIAGNKGEGILTASSNLTIANNVIWGNRSGVSVGDNATVEYNIIQGGFAGTKNYDINPRFVAPQSFSAAPTQAGDYRLSPLSQAIDAGSNVFASNAGISTSTTDLAGNPRYVNDVGNIDIGEGTAPIIDMGVYEFQETTLACNGYSYPYTVTGGVDDLITAIACANSNNPADVIDLNGQTYTLTTPYLPGGRGIALPPFVSRLTLRNGTLDGDNSSVQLLYVGKTTGYLTLDNVTVRNAGNTSFNRDGGAVINNERLEVFNSTFANNATAQAGGAIVNNSTLVSENSTFDSNSAGTDGGAIFLSNGSTMTATDSIFTNNSAGRDGGVVNLFIDSNATFKRTTFAGNTAARNGGVTYGNQLAQVTLISSLLTGNTATGNGGAIFNFVDATATVINSTFAGNTANSGGAIFNEAQRATSSVPESGTLTVANSILWGNSSSIDQSGVPNTSVDYSIVQGGFAGTDNRDVNPEFVAPQPANSAPTTAGDYTLQATSPAIDSGSNPLASDAGLTSNSVDLVGNPRIVDTQSTADTGEGDAPIIDRGAYEYFLLVVDVNEDGIVSPTDAIYVLNRIDSNDLSADVDGDGDVDNDDVTFVQEALGQ